MTRIVVYIQGGVCLGVVSDRMDVEVMIVDYDNEAAGDQRDTFGRAMCDPNLVLRTIAGTEMGE